MPAFERSVAYICIKLARLEQADIALTTTATDTLQPAVWMYAPSALVWILPLCTAALSRLLLSRVVRLPQSGLSSARSLQTSWSL